jgi:hypothetical protein
MSLEGGLRHFDGRVYDPRQDRVRLSRQYDRVFRVMSQGGWSTIEEICAATGDPHASVSARLRDMRKPRNGGHRVDRRRRGEFASAPMEFRLELTGGTGAYATDIV